MDVLLLNTVLNVEVLVSDVLSLDRSLPAAAALALAALRARHRGRGGGIGAGGRRGVQHLEASDRNEGEQAAGLLLGVQREVAEDVLLMGTGSSRRSRSQVAPLILKQHVGRVSATNSGQNLDPGTEKNTRRFKVKFLSNTKLLMFRKKTQLSFVNFGNPLNANLSCSI